MEIFSLAVAENMLRTVVDSLQLGRGRVESLTQLPYLSTQLHEQGFSKRWNSVIFVVAYTQHEMGGQGMRLQLSFGSFGAAAFEV